MTSDEVKDLIELLDKQHPNAVCELEYNSIYELLVAVILSAQCTDKRVNVVTKKNVRRCQYPRANG